MRITKYYLSGGWTFEANFERLDNGMIEITAVVDNRNDETKTVQVAESEIKKYLGKWDKGIESLNENQVSSIISKFLFS